MAVELGYGIVADDGESGRLGHWAIAGIPVEAMAVHSKRAAEIDHALDGQAAVTSFRERAVVARRTRAAKRHTPVEDLMVRWQAELAEIGLHSTGIDHAVEAHTDRRVTRPLSPVDVHEIVGELLSVEGVLAERKVFTRRDVIVAAAPYVFGLDPAILEHLVDEVIDSRDAVELAPTVAGRERAWAPRCVVDTERAIAERAVTRHRSHQRDVIPTSSSPQPSRRPSGAWAGR